MGSVRDDVADAGAVPIASASAVGGSPNSKVDGMSYDIYKLMHLFGIFSLVAALSASGWHGLRGGTRADNPYRRLLAIAHGTSLVLILVGGFGMLARLGIVEGGLPGWILAKLAIWLVLGGALTLARRGRTAGAAVLVGVPLLAVMAAAIALYKPF